MGWGLDVTAYPYVRLWQEDPEAARQDVLQSDVVIWGGVEVEGPEAALEERLLAACQEHLPAPAAYLRDGLLGYAVFDGDAAGLLLQVYG